MLESHGEAVIVIEKVIYFCENSSPLFLRVGQGSKYWLETSTIQDSLIVQIFECKGQLLALRDTFDRKVEPGPVTVLRIRSAII